MIELKAEEEKKGSKGKGTVGFSLLLEALLDQISFPVRLKLRKCTTRKA